MGSQGGEESNQKATALLSVDKEIMTVWRWLSWHVVMIREECSRLVIPNQPSIMLEWQRFIKRLYWKSMMVDATVFFNHVLRKSTHLVTPITYVHVHGVRTILIHQQIATNTSQVLWTSLFNLVLYMYIRICIYLWLWLVCNVYCYTCPGDWPEQGFFFCWNAIIWDEHIITYAWDTMSK